MAGVARIRTTRGCRSAAGNGQTNDNVHMSSFISVSGDDVGRIRQALFLDLGDRARNLSAYWCLLALAAVIAAAGVVADSTATVIGAMIVAPLMTPILGVACALVLADHQRLGRSLALALGGAVVVVVIGYLTGLVTPLDVVASTNGQVADRVSPQLVDLLAALATGLVGAFAVLRSDVSNTLPGVAIAISLVPPLAVAGLTLEARAYGETLGAVVLFGTNVTAIIATGTLLLLLARVRDTARAANLTVGSLSVKTIAAVGVSLVLISVPLAYGSVQVVREQLIVTSARPVADNWADRQGEQVTDVFVRGDVLHIVALGSPSQVRVEGLRGALDEAGLDHIDVEVTMVAGSSAHVPQLAGPE
jgi:uncharacterized hydrophobic protein (TIGR00271 family)